MLGAMKTRRSKRSEVRAHFLEFLLYYYYAFNLFEELFHTNAHDDENFLVL